MSLETVHIDKFPTVFEVWKEILENRPDVVRQTAKVFASHPHGQSDNQEVHVLPRERIIWSDNELDFFGNSPDVKAIGGNVEIRPKDFDPEIDYSGANRWFNEGDILDIDPRYQKSFLMVDLESPPSQDLLELTIKTLKVWKPDWYLLDSGGSYHLIIDRLIEQKEVPKYLGQLIMDMAINLDYPKSKLYGHIGNYLIQNWNDTKKLNKWVESVLDYFGHSDEPMSSKLVFPIDLRYIAHVVKSVCEKSIDESCLRVSSKHGSVPVLVAQQINRDVIVYDCQDDPFDRKQLSLPMV